MSSSLQIEESIKDADLVVGAVLISRRARPFCLTREMVRTMKQGSVFCDVAIDQGGCAETSRATTHDDPSTSRTASRTTASRTCRRGAVPTSTKALTNVTLGYVEAIAEHGLGGRRATGALARGVNVYEGKVTYEAVAEAHGLETSRCASRCRSRPHADLAHSDGFGFFALFAGLIFTTAT